MDAQDRKQNHEQQTEHAIVQWLADAFKLTEQQLIEIYHFCQECNISLRDIFDDWQEWCWYSGKNGFSPDYTFLDAVANCVGESVDEQTQYDTNIQPDLSLQFDEQNRLSVALPDTSIEELQEHTAHDIVKALQKRLKHHCTENEQQQ